MRHDRRPGKAIIGRLKLVGVGLVLAGVGIGRMMSGMQVVRHSNGQPVFSWGLIAGGIVCFILAFIPISWVAKAAGEPEAKRRRGR
jgi:hypothetical protein